MKSPSLIAIQTHTCQKKGYWPSTSPQPVKHMSPKKKVAPLIVGPRHWGSEETGIIGQWNVSVYMSLNGDNLWDGMRPLTQRRICHQLSFHCGNWGSGRSKSGRQSAGDLHKDWAIGYNGGGECNYLTFPLTYCTSQKHQFSGTHANLFRQDLYANQLLPYYISGNE